jgi:hypothetical protein
MNKVSRSILVIGTNHRLQGSPIYPRSVKDPGYPALLRDVIEVESIDFIFEEASECGPTTAERLVESMKDVRQIRYLDIDPHPDLAYQHGIVNQNGEAFPRDISAEQKVEEDFLREELWCKRIKEQAFTNALVICGYLHTLSVTFRLRSAGFRTKFQAYFPEDVLCSHTKQSHKAE